MSAIICIDRIAQKRREFQFPTMIVAAATLQEIECKTSYCRIFSGMRVFITSGGKYIILDGYPEGSKRFFVEISRQDRSVIFAVDKGGQENIDLVNIKLIVFV